MTPKNQQELEKLLKARDAKTKINAKAFKARAVEAKEQCLALQKEAVRAAIAPGITDAEKADAWDRAHAYSFMAGEWERTARLPSDLSETKEAKGSEKGIEQRKKNNGFISADLLDEVREIYDRTKSAEWHRRKLGKLGFNPPGLRQVQRMLKEIRSNRK